MATRDVQPATLPSRSDCQNPETLPENCRECGRWQNARTPFIPRQGDTPATIFFVGQQGGYDEDKTGRNFAGRSGDVLAEAILRAELPPDVPRAFANVVRCGADPVTPAQVKLCKPFILQDLQEVDPKMVVLLGAHAMTSLLGLGGIKKRRGQVIAANGRAYVPTYNPAAVLREPVHARALAEDITLAVDTLAPEGAAAKIARISKRYRTIKTKKDFYKLIAQASEQTLLIVDTEWDCEGEVPPGCVDDEGRIDWLDPTLRLLMLQIAWKTRHGYAIPIDHPESPFKNDDEVKEVLRWLLTTRRLAMHNAEADVAPIHYCLGVPVSKLDVVVDTMLSSMCLRGSDASHALKGRAYLDADTGGYEEGLERWKAERQARGEPTTYGYLPLDELAIPYAAADVDTTAQCLVKDVPKLKEQGQWDFYQRVFRKTHRLSILMRQRGLLVDWHEWAWRQQHLQAERVRFKEQALAIPTVRDFAVQQYEATRKKFTLGSDPQLRIVLFTLMGMEPSGRFTEKNNEHSLDKKAILAMQRLNQGNAEGLQLLKIIQDDASVQTTLSTLEGYADVIWPDGCIHPRWHPFVSSTRRGSNTPNGQNIMEGKLRHDCTVPHRTPIPECPRNLRMILKARPGYRYVGFDYRALEYRLAADYSGDQVMIDGCLPGHDPHKAVMERFGVPRNAAKVMNYGFIYGVQGEEFSENCAKDTGGEVLMTPEEGQAIIDALWTEVYPQLGRCRDTVYAAILRNGYARAITGHRRPLPAASSPDRWIRDEACRQGFNHLMQHTGHAMLEMALQWMQDYIEEHDLDWHLCLDSHDGAVYEVPDAEVMACAVLGKGALEHIGPTIVPAGWMKTDKPAEVKIGTHYGNMTEVEV